MEQIDPISGLPIKAPCTPPKNPLPAGAWDCHAHVMGPFDRFPMLERRRYNPPLAPAEAYLAMLDTMGFARGVLVHATAYGTDPACTADAIARAPDRLRGVCVVEPDIDDAGLEALHAAGFRSIRFTETGPRAASYPGALSFTLLEQLAPRMRALGWHVETWANCATSVANRDLLAACGMPVVFDHMGYFDVAAGVDDATFRDFAAMLRANDFWWKTTPIRLAKGDPSYATVRPFFDALIDAAPDRALFGSDWPYFSLDEARPDTGHLIDLFDAWAPDADLRKRVLVDNPARLYAGW